MFIWQLMNGAGVDFYGRRLKTKRLQRTAIVIVAKARQKAQFA